MTFDLEGTIKITKDAWLTAHSSVSKLQGRQRKQRMMTWLYIRELYKRRSRDAEGCTVRGEMRSQCLKSSAVWVGRERMRQQYNKTKQSVHRSCRDSLQLPFLEKNTPILQQNISSIKSVTGNLSQMTPQTKRIKLSARGNQTERERESTMACG